MRTVLLEEFHILYLRRTRVSKAEIFPLFEAAWFAKIGRTCECFRFLALIWIPMNTLLFKRYVLHRCRSMLMWKMIIYCASMLIKIHVQVEFLCTILAMHQPEEGLLLVERYKALISWFGGGNEGNRETFLSTGYLMVPLSSYSIDYGFYRTL